MRPTTTMMVLIMLLAARAGQAQVGGNAGYAEVGGSRSRSGQPARARPTPSKDELPPTDTSLFVEASVLMNVKADAFVATFGLVAEAETLEGCRAKMDATVAALVEQFRPLGVADDATFVDFTAQAKVYDYDVQDSVAREKLVGFELKKTVAVRYRDKALIDRLIVAASRAGVHDLAKVDYVVTDLAPVHERLAEEAAAVVRAKRARYERLFGIRTRPVPQVILDRTAASYPTGRYASYIAGESGNVGGPDRSRLAIQTLRKSRTFYFDPLDGDGFDRVVDPVVLEPVVQFTLDLRLRYEIETRQ